MSEFNDIFEQTRRVMDDAVLTVIAENEGVMAEAQNITDFVQDPEALVLRETKWITDHALDMVPSGDTPIEHPLVQVEATSREIELRLALGQLFSGLIGQKESPSDLGPVTADISPALQAQLDAEAAATPPPTDAEQTAALRTQLTEPLCSSAKNPGSP